YAGTPSQPAPQLRDGGPATQGHRYMPVGLAMDPADILYIADDWDGVIRKVSPPSQGQIITTVAGGRVASTSSVPQAGGSVFLATPAVWPSTPSATSTSPN